MIKIKFYALTYRSNIWWYTPWLLQVKFQLFQKLIYFTWSFCFHFSNFDIIKVNNINLSLICSSASYTSNDAIPYDFHKIYTVSGVGLSAVRETNFKSKLSLILTYTNTDMPTPWNYIYRVICVCFACCMKIMSYQTFWQLQVLSQ